MVDIEEKEEIKEFKELKKSVGTAELIQTDPKPTEVPKEEDQE